MANGKSKNELKERALAALADWSQSNEAEFKPSFKYGMTLWGTEREFDALIQKNSKTIALQYTTQEDQGSAFRKMATDIIDAEETKELRIVAVMVGEGFPEAFKSWAIRTGHATRYEDLPHYLNLYFGN